MMEDYEIRLQCIEKAIALYASGMADAGIDEMLAKAKEIYTWVIERSTPTQTPNLKVIS